MSRQSAPLRSFHIGLSWSTSGAGGSGRVLESLSENLPRENVQVKGAVLAPADVAAMTEGHFQLLTAPDQGLLRRFLSSRASLRAALTPRPDLLASHFAFLTIPILDQLRRQPFVMHFHGPWAEESRVQGGSRPSVLSKRLIERSVYTRAERIITLSSAFAEVVVKQYGVDGSRVRIIPGAVDLNQFNLPLSKAAARAEWAWPIDRPVIVSVRRLVPRMGLENLIRAIEIVRHRVPEIQLYVAGKGPLGPKLQQLIDNLQLQNNVTLLGFVPENLLANVYQAADLSVVPTMALEGFGLVAVESLAAGTPALVTPIGGLPEVVAGLSSSLVFRSCSAADIADGIVSALSGTVAIPSSAECRTYAEDHFSAARMARQVADVYREIC
ncbi:MAG: glycosyltransferase family 4 protein [Candidatus Sulfotelmatobacter sp.]